MTEERQPNTELREKAQKWIAANPTIGYDWARGMCDQVLTAFAASIQAEAQQQIEEAQKLAAEHLENFQTFHDETHKFLGERGIPDMEPSVEPGKFVFLGIERRLNLLAERAEAAEKQLAEARAERDELAGQVNHDCAFHDELALTNEIHNRFCGENGEPCQVCRLKAEREEKK